MFLFNWFTLKWHFMCTLSFTVMKALCWFEVNHAFAFFNAQFSLVR